MYDLDSDKCYFLKKAVFHIFNYVQPLILDGPSLNVLGKLRTCSVSQISHFKTR